jgi:hypothetical protein
MKEGGEKAINMKTISEILQGPDESLSQFYEHLCEAFETEASENQQMINVAFVGQAQWGT